jgi:hypothetical protein
MASPILRLPLDDDEHVFVGLLVADQYTLIMSYTSDTFTETQRSEGKDSGWDQREMNVVSSVIRLFLFGSVVALSRTENEWRGLKKKIERGR